MALFKKTRVKKEKKNRIKSLDKCPQKKGSCIRIFTMSPKKPNSANRQVARLLLTNGKKITAFIPGIGHNLQKHSTVLVRGGNVPDLPGIRYKLVRGKYDLSRVQGRIRGRSKYGCKKV